MKREFLDYLDDIVVWETIKQDIPPLKPLFQRMLAEEK